MVTAEGSTNPAAVQEIKTKETKSIHINERSLLNDFSRFFPLKIK